ncbi:MAG: hypothetical protein WC488_04270, partial [Candidatus Micrarchaeia archaeon]
MLKRVVFGLIALAFLSFSSEFLPEKYDRPWNVYGWPGDSNVVDYTFVPPLDPGWNSDLLQYSLEQLELEKAGANKWAAGNLSSAKANYTKAKWAKEQIDAFSESGVLPYFVDVGALCSARGIMNCTCLVLGSTVTCDVPYGDEVRRAIALRIFSKEYSTAWKGTMDGAANELETRASRFNTALRDAEMSLADAEYMGICGAESAGSDACENASNFIYAARTNSTSKNYVAFTRLKGVVWEGVDGVRQEIPMLKAGEALQVLGDEEEGEIARALALNRTIAGHISGSLATYKALGLDAEAQVKRAEQESAQAALGESWRIHGGLELSGIGGGNDASVSDQVAKANSNLEEARHELDLARSTYAYGNEGYLATAMTHAHSAIAFSAQADVGFKQAEQDADRLVQQYEAEASAKIIDVERKFGTAAWPARATALYTKAKEMLEKGKAEKKPGLKFEYYAASISYAEEARAVDASAEPDTNWSAVSACRKAKSILENAKKDGIDVSYEEEWLAVVSRSNNASEQIAECEAIATQAVEEAMQEYADLEDSRAEAMRLVELCGSDCDDLDTMVENAEHGIVSGGRMVYPDAVGSLAMLRQKYEYATHNAEESIELQIGRYLSVRSALFSEWAILDLPTRNELDIIVVNNVEYPGEDVQVSFSTPLEFSQEDIESGGSNIRGITYADGRMTMYLRQIGASETQTYRLGRNATLMRTVGAEKTASGNADGSADVEEQRDVECLGSVSAFYVPINWETLDVDGVEVGLKGGFAQAILSEGRHMLNARYLVLDAYEQGTYQNASSLIGKRVYQKYSAYVRPGLDMEWLTLTTSIPSGGLVKELNVITLTGEKISYVEQGGQVLITIYGLKKNKETRYEISYYVDNSSEYLKQELEYLKKLNLSLETSRLVHDAEALFENGDFAGAAVKIRQAYEQIGLEENERSKLQKEREKYASDLRSELMEIDAVLDGRPGTDFKEGLILRRAHLQDLNSSLDGMDLAGQVNALRKYDAGWLPNDLKLYKKNASVKINKLHAAYLQGGGVDSSIEDGFVELRRLYGRFEASGALSDAYEMDTKIAVFETEAAVFFQNRSATDKIMLDDCG